MGRTSVRAAAVVTLAALFAGTATASFAAPSAEEVKIPTLASNPSGHYIVLLDEKPLAGYEGGVSGIAPTKPSNGKKFDAHTANAKRYIDHLTKKQAAVATAAGATIDNSYQVTLNGFSATLTSKQVAQLQGMKGVLSVQADELSHPTAAQTGTEFLGLEGSGGVWDTLGGVGEAGKGIVVGVVDTGIAPENPSFAGSTLGSKKGAEPYLDGNTVVFEKSDGTQYRSARQQGQNWSSANYNTKLVGAKYFSAGAKAAGFKFVWDYLSPRDADGHGSHTTSTAAGNANVPASISGIDFGTISGVAPAAKVAMYKACWNGPDPLSTDDDGCYTSDTVAAIDQAVADGVDVINFSIGGGAATTVLAADDVSFFYAAVAGVFVSVSAGNSGPGASTADHASPWYTTVAASTIPTWEGTVELPTGVKYAGATVTVQPGSPVEGSAVYAGSIPAAGATAAEAALCFLGKIDATAAAGKIVVCDRGTNARVEKSQAVAQAGGKGMVLVNVTPSSLDNDFHSVPTVHIQSTARAALLEYLKTPNPTLKLVGENTTGIETPVPQVAGFSSRGPMLAAGSDVIKPDVSAPGVAILAATENAKNGSPTYGLLSGTSMASPHVAGLGALYLGEHPNAGPGEIKSALMTTAYNTVNADGSDNTDPFAQGAGHVNAKKFLNPGLLYDNGPGDWAAYIENVFGGDVWSDVEPLDDLSNLNLASIGIGSLSAPQTVTRTITAKEAGTYRATVSGMTGVDVDVTPSEVTLAADESATVEITFTKTTADTEAWTTGFLTWSNGSTAVRSPIAVYPVTADAPAEVTASVEDGSTSVEILPGLSGSLDLNTSGLTAMALQVDADNPVDGHSGDAGSGDANGDVSWTVTVPASSEIARFTLDASDDAADLDLFVYKLKDGDPSVATAMWQSASASADEEVTLVKPAAGTYLVVANMYAPTPGMVWDMWTGSVVTGSSDGGFGASPNPLAVTLGTPVSYDLTWSGLDPEARYLGVVQYGDSAVRTVVTVD